MRLYRLSAIHYIHTMVSDILKTIRYAIEAALVFVLLGFFKLMPAHKASDIGGWLGRNIGTRLAASRKARRNIARALPDLDEASRDKAITGMWDNLGRIIAEYPHLEHLALDYTEISGHENLEAALENESGAIFFGAHYGNWEINAAAVLAHYDRAIDLSYRAPNNPWTDKLLMNARTLGGKLPAHAKSRQGGKNMMDAIKGGGTLGILIDQKYNQGISVPFFGIEAMTNPFFVQLAQKYKCPLMPIRNQRLDGASFRLNVYEPLPVFNDDGTPRAVEVVIKDAHTMLEGWIKEEPEHWLWLHRRWKD